MLRLAAAITRARGLGAAAARAIARDLFWADVRALAARLSSGINLGRTLVFADGQAAWAEVPAVVREACEATGRLAGPAEWREVLAQGWLPLTTRRDDTEDELHIARRELLRCALAEMDRVIAFGDDTPYHGMRVRWPEPADHYPHFIVPKGATGTVILSSDVGDPAIVVRLDRPLAGAEEWNNEVHWPLDNALDFFKEVEPIA